VLFKCLDKVKEHHPHQKYKKWCDGHNVLVSMDELVSPGGRAFKPAGNVWRVSYTEKVAGIKTFALHLSDKSRAEFYFKEALMFSGFLPETFRKFTGLDEQGNP